METHSIILSEEDVAVLADLLEDLKRTNFPDHVQIALLEDTLSCAEVRASSSVPPDVVRIHSVVRISDLKAGTKRGYAIVSPELADMQKQLLSVTAPLAVALLGHKQGDVVQAKVPAGVRLLRIEQVRNLARPTKKGSAVFSRFSLNAAAI
jgi:transcription elongation GreA/GreB family factor